MGKNNKKKAAPTVNGSSGKSPQRQKYIHAGNLPNFSGVLYSNTTGEIYVILSTKADIYVVVPAFCLPHLPQIVCALVYLTGGLYIAEIAQPLLKPVHTKLHPKTMVEYTRGKGGISFDDMPYAVIQVIAELRYKLREAQLCQN